MAGAILGTVGAVAGSFFGPVFGQLGYMAGSMLGNLIDPPKGVHNEGNRLDDLTSQTVSYGTNVGTTYGRYLRAGNVFWAKDKVEHKTTSGGGKGQPKFTNYTYTQSFAIGLSENEISGILKIKANGKLLYSSDVATTSGSKIASSNFEGFFRVYNGTEDQLPDVTMESLDGVGNVPAYRGLSYIVFTDFLLSDFGNIIPQFQFEVISKDGGTIKQGIEIIDKKDNYSYIFSNFGSGSLSLGNYFVSTFYQNNLIFKDQSYNFDLVNLPRVTNCSMYNTTLHTSQFYRDYKRYYGPYTYKKEYTDLSFKFDFEQCKITEYNKKDLNFESFISPANHELTKTKNGTILMGAVSQINNDSYALYLNSYAFGRGYFNGSDGISEFEDSILSIGSLQVQNQELTTFFAIDNLFPSGSFFKGVCVSQDQTFAYVFYSDVDKTKKGKVYYSKIVFNKNRASVIETGQFSDQFYYVGVGSPVFNLRGIGVGTSERFHYCCCDNKFIWLYNYFSQTESFVFEVDNNVITKKASINAATGTSNNNVFAANGLLYINDVLSCKIFSASKILTTNKVKLSDVVSDQIERAGITKDLYDVSELQSVEIDGYSIGSDGSARSNIEMLANAYFFDIIESDGKLKAVIRGKDVCATILNDDLIIENESTGESRSDFVFKQIQETSVPREIQVSYMNLDSDYVVGIQYARRIETGSNVTTSLSVPILLTNDKAKQIAETALYNVNLERDSITFSTSIKYMYLEPTDVIKVEDYNGNFHIVRIINKTEGDNGQLTFECVRDQKSSYIRNDIGVKPSDQKPPVVDFIENTAVLPMNLPILFDQQQDQNAYYMCVSAKAEGKYKGSVTFKSFDNQKFENIENCTFTSDMNSTYGVVENKLSECNCFDIDNVSKITVNLINKNNELYSINFDELLNTKNNYCKIGNEIVQFSRADKVDVGKYSLSGFIRGIGGSDFYANSHTEGEQFVLLDFTKINTVIEQLGTINTQFYIVGLSVGQNEIGDGDKKLFNCDGLSIKPLSVYSFMYKNNTDFNIKFFRRARINAGLLNNVDTPLDEQSEQYIIEIYKDNTYSEIVNDYSINKTEFVYTEAMQISDFGSVQQNLYTKIYMLSSRVGRGFASMPILV